jgi:hypothetical protein
MPGENGKFGRVYFGYNIPEGFQNVGGINEHGLWYDGASLPNRSDIKNYYNKPEYKGELCEKALETCENLNDVIALYKSYYTPHWQGHSIWGDKYGNSIVIEFGERDVVFIHRKDSYQLITNHYLLDSINKRWLQCRRFQTAETMLKEVGEPSIEKFTSILDATHQNGFTPTLYSNIYDLTNGIVYIYNFHTYFELVKIDIYELLEEGDQNISLPDLFHSIRLDEPANKEPAANNNLILSWYGNPGKYSVLISKNQDFNDYTIFIEDTEQNNSTMLLLFAFSAPLLVLCRIKRDWKPKYIKLSFALIICISITCCSKLFLDPYPDSETRHQVEVSNLEPATTYYWKVICKGDSQITSESICRSFTTLDII